MDIELPIVLRKKRSPRYVVIMADDWMNDEDDPDWFIRVSYRKNKTHAETRYSIILKKEIERWVRDFKRDGYIEDKDFNQDDLAKTKLLD